MRETTLQTAAYSANSAPMVTRSRDGSPRRQQILEALAQMLESAPGERITTAALAAAVGVSEAALYRHFPSKARMYEGLIDFIEESLFGRIRAILDEETTAVPRCHKVLSLVLAFAERNPGITRILAGDALTGETERLRIRIGQLLDRLETQLKQIIREGEVRDGLRVAISTSAAAELMLALTEGKIRQFVRSGFHRRPSTHWQEQWPILAASVFHR